MLERLPINMEYTLVPTDYRLDNSVYVSII